ncbi:Gfo/Idh/MocA family oxidoreductase [bacterium]|nr:Gfo/Idh/MocA family oxidoreductase [bacterium]
MKNVEIIIIGAGDRGSCYSSYVLACPESAKIVGVAEPREEWRNRLVQAHKIPVTNIAKDWRELISRPKFADAVIIATQDSKHVEPAIAFARKGYHIMLEKPMAPDENSCRQIAFEVLDAGIIFAVCHVLRYTRYTQKIKEIISNGIIGDVVSLQRLEPVGYWHQAHSFVRGNWRREDQSSAMLMAKCCHDIDWIRYIMGNKCISIQSFGTLKHFRADQKPEGAASRCLNCSIEPQCAYSAKKFYLQEIKKGNRGWPLSILTPEITEERVTEALRTGPYGRCVYDCDNDVVDNQVVNMLFETGQTAALTMTAFTEARHRETKIFGTKGELIGDGNIIRHFDFLNNKWEEINMDSGDHSILGGHGGGDYLLIKAFIEAVKNNDKNLVLSGPKETLETHLMVFAAEKSRKENKVVNMCEMYAD